MGCIYSKPAVIDGHGGELAAEPGAAKQVAAATALGANGVSANPGTDGLATVAPLNGPAKPVVEQQQQLLPPPQQQQLQQQHAGEPGGGMPPPPPRRRSSEEGRARRVRISDAEPDVAPAAAAAAAPGATLPPSGMPPHAPRLLLPVSAPPAAAPPAGRPPSPLPPAPPTAAAQQQQRAAATAAAAAGGVQVLRGGPRGSKLRERRGGVSASFTELQRELTTDALALSIVSTRAAGLKHIGFGPFKRENQDEFFIQVGHYGDQPGANLFCVFDGHGSHGKDAAAYSRQVLPALLDGELRKFFARNSAAAEPPAADTTKGAVEVLITEVFGETEKSLTRAGVNLASSGTTASVVYQLGSRLWVASAGDSRVILCQRTRSGGKWRSQPLTIDHRPRRPSERERVEAAGARVQPKRLPSGRLVGEPRLWLQEVSSPGLLLSRSLGDLMAATVGCTSDPEITYVTLSPARDQFLVLATDGVWDVCDIVTESPDPHIACRRVLDAALYEWEERMSADNITVLVVEFDWGDLDRSTEDDAVAFAAPPLMAAAAAAAGRRPTRHAPAALMGPAR
ncbi:MAG: phosphatase 2C-like domain-containing protein [Monoraphidium minutum]|nr:MAG: phosphatase 2C-like domain-containing protein [Monoraphidium minutum]